MLDLGSLILQVNGTIPIVTAPPTTTDIATTITALIIAIAGLMGAVGTILKTASDRKELAGHKEGLRAASDRLEELSQHMISSKEDIKSLAEITYEFSPEKAQQIVNQQNVKLVELTRKLEEANARLSKVPGALAHI